MVAQLRASSQQPAEAGREPRPSGSSAVLLETKLSLLGQVWPSACSGALLSPWAPLAQTRWWSPSAAGQFLGERGHAWPSICGISQAPGLPLGAARPVQADRSGLTLPPRRPAHPCSLVSAGLGGRPGAVQPGRGSPGPQMGRFPCPCPLPGITWLFMSTDRTD